MLGVFVVVDEFDGKCIFVVFRISSVLFYGIIFWFSIGYCMCKFVENYFNLKVLGVNFFRLKIIVFFC